MLRTVENGFWGGHCNLFSCRTRLNKSRRTSQALVAFPLLGRSDAVFAPREKLGCLSDNAVALCLLDMRCFAWAWGYVVHVGVF